MTTIDVNNLSFGYNQDSLTLRDINLHFEEPGLICIIGPNGVGKSTLVKCIDKLLKPSGGTITIDGRDISEMHLKEVASVIGFVPAKTQDTFSMTVVDTVMMGLYNTEIGKNNKACLERAYKALDLIGMMKYDMRSFNSLSAGQHQKIAIARGIAQDTPVLILDEPTSNLDVRHQVYVAELLRALAEKEGKLVIMICHDLNIAARFAHEIVVMSKPGVIEAIGKPSEVITTELIRKVYGIDCDVIEHDGSPHVILGSDFVADYDDS